MSEWISVKDKLPDNHGKPKDHDLAWLVFSPDYGVRMCYLHPDYWHETNITHWQPLPAFPD